MSRIVVLGGLNMDLVIRAPRFAAAGETIAGSHFSTIPGGKGANQAVSIARLGGDVAMIGRVGADDFGGQLRDVLAQEGVSVGRIGVDETAPTGVALITVDDKGENSIIFVPGANNNTSERDVTSGISANRDIEFLVMPIEVPMPCIAQAAEIARERGATVILNAAPALPLSGSLLQIVDFLIVNETEAIHLTGMRSGPPRATIAALRALGARNIVLTLGAKGALYYEQGGAAKEMFGFPVRAVDTTAAGDAFVGAFAVALSNGLSLDDAVFLASAAGALTVTKHGAQPSLPTQAELQAFLSQESLEQLFAGKI